MQYMIEERAESTARLRTGGEPIPLNNDCRALRCRAGNRGKHQWQTPPMNKPLISEFLRQAKLPDNWTLAGISPRVWECPIGENAHIAQQPPQKVHMCRLWNMSRSQKTRWRI